MLQRLLFSILSQPQAFVSGAHEDARNGLRRLANSSLDPLSMPSPKNPAAGYPVGKIREVRRVRILTYLNVTICMTQGPAELRVAVALLLPAVVTLLSSAISPSGDVMIRDVNPLPAAFVDVATVSAPKINS
jgi:hypothetical protein